MNKFFATLAFAASTIIFAACSSNDTDDIINDVIDNEPKTMSFLVGTPSSNSRAVVSGLNDNATPTINWEESDYIRVWGSGSETGYPYAFSSYTTSFHNYAAFTGTAFDASKYFLMYPNQTDATFDGTSNITATIPTIQTATLNSFDPNAAICMGATEGKEESVTILHACAFLKITTVKDCRSITISAKNKNTDGTNWKVAGKVGIEPSSAGAKIVDFSEAADAVKLTADGTANPSTTFPAGTYLIAIITSTHFPGLDVKVDYADNTNADKSTDQIFSFSAATIYNLGTATPTTTTNP